VFVSDGYGNRRIVHFDAQGKFVKAWGEFGGGRGQFCLPHQIVVDARGFLYVADRNSGRILSFDQQGKCLDEWCHLDHAVGLCASRPATSSGSAVPRPNRWYRDGSYPPPKDALFMRFSTDGKTRQIWTVPLLKDGEGEARRVQLLHAVASLTRRGTSMPATFMGKRIPEVHPQSSQSREMNTDGMLPRSSLPKGERRA